MFWGEEPALDVWNLIKHLHTIITQQEEKYARVTNIVGPNEKEWFTHSTINMDFIVLDDNPLLWLKIRDFDATCQAFLY